MSAFLTGLLIILKCIGIVLLVLLVLLFILLIIPVGVEAVWKTTDYSVYAKLGPMRFLLLPKKEKTSKAGKAGKQKEEKNTSAKQPESVTSDAKNQTADHAEKEAEVKSDTPNKQDEPEPKAETSQENQQDEGVLATLKSLAGDTLEDLKREPLETVQHLLEMAAPLGAQLLHSLHIRHMRIVWTVTREDAAQTAIAYGQEIALCNVLLTRAKQILDIQADELRLEPDFAGKMADIRHLSCQITAMPCIILIIGVRLIWRVLHSHPHSQKSSEKYNT